MLICLQKVPSAPNDIQYHIRRCDPYFTTFPYEITSPELANFEDLYYATWAQIKTLLNEANLLLSNGFKQPQHDHFQFLGEPLRSLGPINLGDFQACLLSQQLLLQDRHFIQLLEASLKNHFTQDGAQHQTFATRGAFSPTLVERSLSNPGRRDSGLEARGKAQHAEEGVQLSRITNMSSGMIFAYLSEKYRTEHLDAQMKATQPYHTSSRISDKPYVSPYNLDERAKKLHMPGRPELPCICDPDCMCVPLCASDPSRNCLCEENGLFARVTEGMDIDELDVPDLIRRRRQSSDCSSCSVASNSDDSQERQDDTPYLQEPLEPSINEHVASDEVATQRDEQLSKAFTEFSSTVAPNRCDENHGFHRHHRLHGGAYTLSSEYQESLSYGEEFIIPPRIASLSYQEALVRPFAKQCDTPPRRQITRRRNVARRLFSGASEVNPRSWRLSLGGRSTHSAPQYMGVTKQGTKGMSPLIPSFRRNFIH